MPRVLKTVIPRIRKSLRDRGLVTTLCRSILLPVHLVQEYRAAQRRLPGGSKSDFDRTHGVTTDGDYEGWTFLSDLNIKSPNWIEANDYLGIEPERFAFVLTSLDIPFEKYTFVDFGSGMGRALLLASEFGFKEIVGLEFSRELHVIAEDNIHRYRSDTQKSTNIRSVNIDFVDFDLPSGPLVLFFFDPCRGHMLKQAFSRIERTLLTRQDPLYIAYVAPRSETEQLFGSSTSLREIVRNSTLNFIIYESRSGLTSV